MNVIEEKVTYFAFFEKFKISVEVQAIFMMKNNLPINIMT